MASVWFPESAASQPGLAAGDHLAGSVNSICYDIAIVDNLWDPDVLGALHGWEKGPLHTVTRVL